MTKTKKQQRWPKENVDLLLKVGPKKTTKQILKMKEFEKYSFAAIDSKMKRLGISGPKRRKTGNHYVSLWSPLEVKWLKLNWGKMQKAQIINDFEIAFEYPRSWESISRKAYRMNLGQSFKELQAIGELNQETPIEAFLYLLTKSKRPLSSDRLCESIELRSGESISNGRLGRLRDVLKNKGYDIKRIPAGGTINYAMVRTGEISSDMYYKHLGDITSELVQTSDWHMCSTNFSPEAWDAFIDDIVEHSVADITVSGDLIQCLGVHKLEVPDVKIWEIDVQVEYLVQKLQEIPKEINVHIVIGNHEEKLKHKVQVGYDALAHAVSKMNEAGFHNCHYYGAVAKLRMDDEYDFLMMHSAGGVTYATSYRVERVFNNLIERPDIFQVGHTHQLMQLSKAPKHELVIAGCMQRENAWLLNKGLTSMVGWYGIRGYSPEKTNFRRVTPRVH